MAINIHVTVDARFLDRWMSVARMRQILSTLPGDAELSPNRVGNLNVHMPDHTWLGYVDFNEESFETIPSKEAAEAELTTDRSRATMESRGQMLAP